MSQFPIDVDAEAIFLDGGWYTREDLSRRVRAMLDSGDFNVARPSMALQELTQMMQGVRTMAFRAQPELADALTALATRLGQSVGGVIREAITQYITDAHSEPVAAQQAPVQVSQPPQQHRSEETVRAPMPTSTTAEELPKVIIEPTAPVIAGPGALKAAGVEPVELTQRKAAGAATPAAGEPESSEQRWFKQ